MIVTLHTQNATAQNGTAAKTTVLAKAVEEERYHD